jgi:hypothetical protein
MRLVDSRWGSSGGVSDVLRGYEAERVRRSWVSSAFTAAWGTNLVAIGVAAVLAGPQHPVVFAVLVALGVGFLSMLLVMDHTWRPDRDEIPFDAVKPVNEMELARSVVEPEDRSIPAETRKTWWYLLALGLWLAWAAVATVSIAETGTGEGWIAFSMDLVTVIVAWLGLVIACIGFVPPEQPG